MLSTRSFKSDIERRTCELLVTRGITVVANTRILDGNDSTC